jgi:gluconolactonase
MMARTLVCFCVVVSCYSTVRAQILPPGATPQLLTSGYRFTEGPLFDHNGGLYFSDLDMTYVQSRIYRYDIAAKTTALVDPNSGGTNGTYFNANGQIVACERDRRQVTLRSLANVATVQQVLANNWQGAQFNGPNDLVVDSTGGIYFTDPDYENRQSVAEATYYLSNTGVLSRVVTGITRPNGVVLSPNGNTLYLAGWSGRFIRAYDVTSPGVLTNPRTFASMTDLQMGPDGITIDPAGNVYASVRTTVRAWNPSGQVVMNLTVPQSSTNVEFGGPTGKTLFITAGTAVYGIDLNIVPEPQIGVLIGLVYLMHRHRSACRL